MRTLSAIVLILFLTGSVVPPAQASEVSAQDIFKDAFYGGLLGGLIGGALLIFKEDRSEHWDMVGYGAAIGVIGGAAYGLTRAGRSLAEIEDGKVVYRFPSFQLESERPVPGRTLSTLKTNLVSVRF